MSSTQSPVHEAFRNCTSAFVGVALFSGVINVLMLTGSIYMLQVYDRVLTSRSVPTLLALSLIVLAAFCLQGALDSLRSRILNRIGARFDEALAPKVYEAITAMPLRGARPEQVVQTTRDVDQVRNFLASAGPTAFFDMPWMPIFFVGCFILHPWLGWLAVCGGGIIIALTLWAEARNKAPTAALMTAAMERHSMAESGRRNAEAIRALGMISAMRLRWTEINERHVNASVAAGDAGGGIGALARVFRMVLQSAVLGLGAYLAVRQEVSAGAMIAASIMTSRALAPIEVAVAHWKGFAAARQGYARLTDVFRQLGEMPERIDLPRPRRSLEVEELTVGAPGLPRPLIHNISFKLKAGNGLGIIGPSASGKSTLVRALVGVRSAMRGSVRIDGAAVEHWSPDAIGRDIGYLPQDVQLFEGTVAENIARFDPDSSAEKIMTAAIMAGAHDMIQRLANGYETRLDGNGTTLSGGQQQRIGLARVLYGNPFLVVLDEPNSNLDSEGDEALLRAVRLVRERGGIVIMVTHRPTAIAALDMVAVMADGHMKAIGPRDEVLRTVLKPAARQEAVASGDGSQAVRPKPVVAVAKPVPPAVAAAG